MAPAAARKTTEGPQRQRHRGAARACPRCVHAMPVILEMREGPHAMAARARIVCTTSAEVAMSVLAVLSLVEKTSTAARKRDRVGSPYYKQTPTCEKKKGNGSNRRANAKGTATHRNARAQRTVRTKTKRGFIEKS